MIRITIDFECPAEEWWENGGRELWESLIEGFDKAGISKVLEQHFDIDPQRYVPAVMLALGYRADGPMFPKTRRAMDDVVSWV